MQLTFDEDVETFRSEFISFLDEHLPPEADAVERSRSTSHIPEWSRRWQRLQFDHGWLLPGNQPEFGGRNATLLQQFVHREELSRRRVIQSCNPQGVGIIAASLLAFGSPEQKHRWAVPILRGEMTASLGMSEPGAGSDLAGLRTAAVRDGDDFVVNGQKVWTSGAHDSDVLLTFVRTDPEAPKHKGVSVLLIPTDTPGVECRPFAYVYDSRPSRLQRGVLHRRSSSRREPGRSSRRRLARGERFARARTHFVVDELRRPVAIPGPGLSSRYCAGSRSLRHLGDGRPGAASARFGGAGAGVAR